MNQGKRTGIDFKCGHHGLGNFCHRCEAADILETRARDGVVVVSEPSKAKKVRGVPRTQVSRKASKPQVDAMLREVARLRLKPGQKPLTVAEAVKAEPPIVPGPIAKKPPTIEALREKFSTFGAVSAKTLKTKQRASGKK